MNYLLKMAQRQDSLNEITVKGWRNKGLNFRRALRLEAAEAMESTPWKWWKDGEMDTENLIIEAVDMMHFGLSIALMEGYSGWTWLDEQVKILFDSMTPDIIDLSTMQDAIDDIMYMSFLKPGVSAAPSDIIYVVAKLMWLLGMSRDDMFKMYFSKNVLNEFRQANGYKEGTYIKQWGRDEDNVFMQSFVSNIGISDHFEDDLYNGLTDRYSEVKEESAQ